MFTTWWVWALFALLLAALELLAPAYVFLGFAIGAGLVAVGLLTGIVDLLVGDSGHASAILLIGFGILSGIAWVALRRTLGGVAGKVQTFERDINDD